MRGVLTFATLAAMYFPGCTTSKMQCVVLVDGLKVVTRCAEVETDYTNSGNSGEKPDTGGDGKDDSGEAPEPGI